MFTNMGVYMYILCILYLFQMLIKTDLTKINYSGVGQFWTLVKMYI